jgi:hypothetical protein
MLNSVWIMALVLPLCLALGTSGMLLYRGGKRRGASMAELGVALGFLGAYVALAGGIPFLDDLPNGVIGEIAVLLVVLAAILALWMPGPRLSRWLIGVLSAAALIWSVGGREMAFATLPDLLDTGFGVAAAFAVAFRLQSLGQGSALPMLILACVVLSLSATAYFAQAPLFTELFLALAAAIAGFLVWCRPFAKRPVGAAGLLIAVMLVLVLAMGFWRSAIVTPWSVPVLVLAFWADRIAEWVPGLDRFVRRRSDRPVALIGGAVLPSVAAVALAALLSRLYPAS